MISRLNIPPGLRLCLWHTRSWTKIGLVLALAFLANSLEGPTIQHAFATDKQVTYFQDVALIIHDHCSSCHRPGEVARLPLLTYQDAKQEGPPIAAAVRARLMPPWKPVAGFGEFQSDPRLSDAEIATLESWVREGMPEGDPKAQPPAPRFTSGWQLGSPDLVLTMAQPFEVPANTPDLYECFILPTHLTEDRYVVAIEERPSYRPVVHHSIVVEDKFGAARRMAQGAGAYPCFGGFGFPAPGYIGFWTPGVQPQREPPGVARLLKKDCDVVVQVHFHPARQPAKEQISLGLYFAKQPPEHIPFDLSLATMDIDIPPGEPEHRVSSFVFVPEDVEVLSIIPHCHLLCRAVKVTAKLPSGGSVPLIYIYDWDFDWQRQYWYNSPLFLPQGTRVDMEMTFDNSAANPRNPNHPPKRVTWGEQSTDEMAEIHLEAIPAHPPSSPHK